jgi:GAF domain-containing protein
MSAERNPIEEERNTPEQATPERASDQNGKNSTPPGKKKRATATSSRRRSKHASNRIENLFVNLEKEPVDPGEQKPDRDAGPMLHEAEVQAKPDSRIPREEPIIKAPADSQKVKPPSLVAKEAPAPPSEEKPILAPDIFVPRPSPPERETPLKEISPESPKPVFSPVEQPPSGKAKILGFQSFSHEEPPSAQKPDEDGKGSPLEEEILPASKTMTSIAQDSVRLQQLVAKSAQADQPAMLAYAKPFDDLQTQEMPWGEYQDGGAPARVARSLLLEILDESPTRTWSEDELLLVEQVTDQLSLALENARLHEETRRQLKEQIALRQATAVLSSSMDTDTILAQLTEQMCRAISATSAYISSYNPENLEVTVISEYCSPQASPKELVSDLGKTYLDEADAVNFLEMMRTGKSVESHYDDPEISEYEREHMSSYDAKSILYIPLKIQNQVVGVTEIWESRQRREFTSTEINLCLDISRQASVAMERAMLFEQTQNALSALEISERYQKSVAQAVAVLTERGIAALSDVLRLLGQAAKASRAYYIETQVDPRGAYWRLIAEWCNEGVPSQLGNPD